MIFSKLRSHNRPIMNTFAFDVPLLGQSFFMYADVLRLSVSDSRHLSLYNDRGNEPFRCPLFTRHPHHKKLLAHMKEHPTTLRLKEVSKRHYVLFVSKHPDDIRLLAGIIKSLFDVRQVVVKACVLADNNCLGKCAFHLSDLYEMGYATLTPALFWRPAMLSRCDVYTGLSVHASNPLHHYPTDYTHFELSCHDSILVLSLQNLSRHRPDIALRPIVVDIIRSLPLNPRKADYFLREWDLYHCFEVRPRNLSTPVHDWKAGLFLHHFSRILDLFHSYSLTQRFSAHFVL